MFKYYLFYTLQNVKNTFAIEIQMACFCYSHQGKDYNAYKISLYKKSSLQNRLRFMISFENPQIINR